MGDLMFNQIKLWIYGIGAAIFTTVAALMYRKGRKDVEQKHVQRRMDAMKDKQDVEREIKTQDDKHLVDLISNRD